MTHLKLWLRYALQSPARTVFLILSLSVSLGGVVAASSLSAAVSWRDLPFFEADSLVTLEARTREGQSQWWSWAELEAVVHNTRPSLAAVAGYTVADVEISSEAGHPPNALLATMVSPAFFQVLGVGVSAGRVFSEVEHHSGGPRVVLLSHELWQRRYGGDPNVVGRTVTLSGPEYLGEPDGRHLVIGVLAPQTWLFWRRFDLVMPLRAKPDLLADPRIPLFEHVVARLGPTTTVASARLLAPALTTTVRSAGGTDATKAVVVEELKSALFRDLQPKLRFVMAMALVVFVLAGANVLVAASSAAVERQRETALRLAVGAVPRRLARDAGVQLALTMALASLLASLVSGALISVLVRILPDAWLARIPGGAGAVHLEITGLTTLSLGALAVATASAVWTWRQVARLAVSPLLDAIQRGDAPSRQRWRAAIVGSEVALCAAVVLVTTTLGMQLWQLERVDLGVRAERTVAVWINANASRYADAAVRGAYFERLSDELRRVPGVEAVGGIDLTFQFDWQTTVIRAGGDRDRTPVTVLDRVGTPSYLEVSGVTLVDGRWFQAQDRAGAPDVAVVSRSLADALWPQRRAVGRTLQFDASKSNRPMTVVGVVSDIRSAPQARPARVFYRPVAQSAPLWLYFLLRTNLTTEQASNIQSAIWRVDRDQALDGPWALREWIQNRTASVRFLASLTRLLAGIAIVLAAAGLHALMQSWVQAARRELAIRRAIGASHRHVVAWFARRWAIVVAPALALGILAQFVLMHATASQVEGIQPASVGQLSMGTLAVVVYACGAASTALIRALRTDERVVMQ